MKLLVDTSVWSLALRRKTTASLSPEEQRRKTELIQAVQDGRVVMLGLLRQELLSGIKEKAQFDKVKAALDSFLDEPISTEDHEYAARVYNECRNLGIQAGTVDILMCAVAARRGWKVLSTDDGLNHCLAITQEFHEKQKKVGPTETAKKRRMRK